MQYLLIVLSLISVGFVGCAPETVAPEVTRGVILSRQPEEISGFMVKLTGVEPSTQRACEFRVLESHGILSRSTPGKVRFQLGFESESAPVHSHCGHGHDHGSGHDHGHGDCDTDHDGGEPAKQFQYFPVTEFQTHDPANSMIHASHSQVLMNIALIDQGIEDVEFPKTVEVQAKLHAAGKKGLTDVTRVCVLENPGAPKEHVHGPRCNHPPVKPKRPKKNRKIPDLSSGTCQPVT